MQGISCDTVRTVRRKSMKSLLWSTVPSILALAAIGCGPSQADYDARGHQIQQLTTQLHTVQTERDHLNETVASLQASGNNMAARLRALGEDVNRLQATTAQTQSELEAAHHR